MEDIALGRELESGPVAKTVTNVVTPAIIGTSRHRTRMVFAGDGTNTYRLAPTGLGVANAALVTLTPQTPIAILRIEEWGPILGDSWEAIGSAATQLLGVLDCSLRREK